MIQHLVPNGSSLAWPPRLSTCLILAAVAAVTFVSITSSPDSTVFAGHGTPGHGSGGEAGVVVDRRHPESAELQRALDDVVQAGAPGAVLLLRDGNRTIRLASGVSDIAVGTPMRPNLRTRIGGLTKTYTASVVMQLVAEGDLELDDTVDQWLPSIMPNGADITVRALLNHTNGIYDYAQDPTILAPYLEGNLTQTLDPRRAIEVAAQHGSLFEPGTALSYSNTSFVLLAMIVEQVTGHRFERELNHRLFRPLGLGHTSYPDSSTIRGPHVHGYKQLDGESLDLTALSPTLFGAAGAIVSDADDVARFYRALLQRRLFGQHELDAMMTIDPVATGGVPDAGILGGGWGLGLLRETFPCGEAWGHDSETPGYMTAAWNSRDGQRQIVVIVNTDATHDEPVSQAMRDVLVTAYCGEG